MNNETLIAELDGLNEKRTQGDWVYHVDKYRVKIESNFIPDQEVICLADCGDKAAGNGIFIAKAPEMYKLIKAQQAEIARLRDGLEGLEEHGILDFFIDHHHAESRAAAKQAKALLKPQEQEEI